MGGTLTASLVTGVMAGCSTDQQLDWTPKVLTAQQVIVTVSLAEQILPATSTPGAKEARIERFIDSMVAGYLSNAEKSIFEGGISRLNQRNFIKMMPEEQHNVVIELVEEARTQAPDSNSRPFFLLFKEMTLLGFFTSKIGATQVLNYDPIPGGFEGCKPLSEVGGKTWAS